MQARTHKGFTLIELLIVVTVIGIIMAIAIPGLLRARTATNEASAIASMRAVVSAEIAYASGCGNNGFAVTFTTLGVPPPGSTQAFLSTDLAVAAPQKSGYNLTLAAGAGAVASGNDCNGTPTQSAFYTTAVPATFGTSGNRSFA